MILWRANLRVECVTSGAFNLDLVLYQRDDLVLEGLNRLIRCCMRCSLVVCSGSLLVDLLVSLIKCFFDTSQMVDLLLEGLIDSFAAASAVASLLTRVHCSSRCLSDWASALWVKPSVSCSLPSWTCCWGSVSLLDRSSASTLAVYWVRSCSRHRYDSLQYWPTGLADFAAPPITKQACPCSTVDARRLWSSTH